MNSVFARIVPPILSTLLLPLAGDDAPRLAQVDLQRVVPDLIQLDPDPFARPRVRRLEIRPGGVLDQEQLPTFTRMATTTAPTRPT
jgi:hypothetical protein